MKKSITIIALLIALAAGAFTSHIVMKMTMKDGSVRQYITEDIIDVKISEVEHDYVDLGLPSGTLWATTNLGAQAPEDYGYYISWGESEPKDSYSTSNYAFSGWYPFRLRHEEICDENGILLPEYDAATVAWGEAWRMPTPQEAQELLDYCTFTWATLNEVAGSLITGPNGNSIFVPASGYRTNSGISHLGSNTNQRTSGFQSHWSSNNSSKTLRHDEVNWHGMTIRPVMVAKASVRPIPDQIIPASKSECSVEVYTYLATSLAVNCDNPAVSVSLAADRTLTVNFGEPSSEDMTAVVTVTASHPRRGSGSTTFAVTRPALTAHDYVDLGLPSGTLWSSSDLGASAPEALGDCFSFGEVKTREDYSGNADCYSWHGITTALMTEYGIIDSDGILTPDYDPATVHWGNDWHTADKTEWEELRANCKWEWTTVNGKAGHKVTGPNGNWIFLPAWGYMRGKGISGNNQYPHYWSSYRDNTWPWYFRTSNSSVDFSALSEPYLGMHIRPVSRNLPVIADVGEQFISSPGLTNTVALTAHAIDNIIISVDSDIATANISDGNVVTTFSTSSADDASVTVTLTGYNGLEEVATMSYKVSRVPADYRYVDLGLPSGLKWATRNIGADTPDEAGKYIAYGETEERAAYTAAATTFQNVQTTGMRLLGALDDNLDLTRPYDAASVIIGEDWRLPSKIEMEELVTKCDWAIVNAGSNHCWKVTGPSGKYILLPLAGYKKDNNVLDRFGEKEQTWTSTAIAGSCNSWYTNHSNYKEYQFSNTERRWGFPVRAVYDPAVSVTPVRNQVIPNTATSNTVTIDGRNIASVSAVASDPGITVYCSGRNVTATFGAATSIDRSATITVTVNGTDGSSKQTSYTVTQPCAEDYGYVDLGLPSGTVWATHNVGATLPEEAGNYVAWGETEPRPDKNYSKENTSWQGPDAEILKRIGILNSTGKLTSTYDAATYRWGSGWHMPTEDDFNELINNCTWVQESINGSLCYRITGRNGKSIILPVAGFYRGTSFSYANVACHYWTSTFQRYFRAENSSIQVNLLNESNLGMTIRPVKTDAPVIVAIPDRTLSAGNTTLSITVKAFNVDNLSATSSNPSAATVSVDGNNLTIVFADSDIDESQRVTFTVRGSRNGYKTAVTTFDVCRFVDAVGAVDLGLPSGRLWADRNIGASTPVAFGSYVCYGEIAERGNYAQGAWGNINSYYLQQAGLLDNAYNLTGGYDLATTALDSRWRTPSRDDLSELMENCDWTIVKVDETMCFKVTGPNGNYIIIPLAGNKNNTSSPNIGTGALFWTATSGTRTNNAYYGEFQSLKRQIVDGARNLGLNVRPVYNPAPEFDYIRPQRIAHDSRVNVVTVSGRNISSISATVDNSSMATVSIDGNTVTTSFSGFSTVDRTVTVTLTGRSADGTESNFSYTVTHTRSLPSDYVDLGLPSGTLWATCNVGASTPEEIGEYIAWGETEPIDDLDYSTANCALYGIMPTSLQNFGLIQAPVGDKKAVLSPDYDAATRWAGEGWRMPTVEEWTELQENCTFTRTNLNGMTGHKVTNKNGDGSAWIFLPDGGYYRGNRQNDLGANCHYWSASVNPSTTSSFYFRVSGGSIVNSSSTERNLGMTIRPVRSHADPDMPVIPVIADMVVECSNTLVVPIAATNTDHLEVAVDHPDAVSFTVTGSNITFTFTEGSSIAVKATVRAVSVEGRISQRSFTIRYLNPEAVGYVDLGLPSGILWASCNVGAESPEDSGLYVAFGELLEKKGYSTDSYIHNMANTTACMNSSQMKEAGITDEDGNLTPAHDIASYYLGGEWHTPDGADYSELKANCTFDIVTINGKKVTKVTGPNGNAIYLPANGRRSALGVEYFNGYGEAWCRNHVADQRPVWVSIVGGTYTLYTNQANEYWRGRTVRPVRKASSTN